MAQERSRLLELLESRLPDGVRRALWGVISLAERRRFDLCLVGGAVRDLLLGEDQVDVDLVTDGDVLALASDASQELGARLVSHPRFGTAAVQGEGVRLDLARARAESYERPGALPSVRPAALEEDLARRDFTVNAMALRLVGPQAGLVVDPHGGRADLDRRLIRVLHGGSFQDDATRMLRAVRYAGRLRFRLERNTGSLLRRDLPYVNAVSGARLRREIECIAGEAQVGKIVRHAVRLGLLATVHPALGEADRGVRAVARLPRLRASHRDAVLLCLLLADASPAEAEGVIGRLALTGRQAGAARGFLALRKAESKLARPPMRPSEVTRVLTPYPPLAVQAFVLAGERRVAADRARRYLEEWRFIRPRLDGHDVEALGIPQGPEIGAALASLREARLDGVTRDREDEMALVLRMRRRRHAGAEGGCG